MSKRENVEIKTEDILKEITDPLGLIIYDIEFVKEGSDYYLRCYIDKDGGVTIDDCETVSRAMSDKLDENDYIAEAYILEVSSPGLGRILKKDRHLQYSIGQEVEIKTYKPIDGNKEFVGILNSFDSEKIVICISSSDNESDENKIAFDRKDIAVIRLTIDF